MTDRQTYRQTDRIEAYNKDIYIYIYIYIYIIYISIYIYNIYIYIYIMICKSIVPRCEITMYATLHSNGDLENPNSTDEHFLTECHMYLID